MPELARILLLLPAYNEEASLANLLPQLRARCHWPVLVVDDGSVDRTAEVARTHGAHVLVLPHNLGVGGAVQTGCAFAWHHGFDYLLRLDADGQHPPEHIVRLFDRMKAGDLDMVVGSRFLDVPAAHEDRGYTSTAMRQVGIRVLARFLSVICQQRITDPTSGCFMINRRLMYFFAQRYPTDYPEPEALALISRQGYRFGEVGMPFRERAEGVSSIKGWGTWYFMVKVWLALLVDRARGVDARFSRESLEYIRGASL